MVTAQVDLPYVIRLLPRLKRAKLMAANMVDLPEPLGADSRTISLELNVMVLFRKHLKFFNVMVTISITFLLGLFL